MGCSKENGYSIPRRKEKDYWLVVREKKNTVQNPIILSENSFPTKKCFEKNPRKKSSKNRGKKIIKKNPEQKSAEKSSKNPGENHQKIRGKSGKS